MATPTRPGTRFARPRGTNSEQIAKEIRRYIAEQGLRPDDRLGTEHELAHEFGVSRPTLREALRLLGSSHLVRASRGARRRRVRREHAERGHRQKSQ